MLKNKWSLIGEGGGVQKSFNRTDPRIPTPVQTILSAKFNFKFNLIDIIPIVQSVGTILLGRISWYPDHQIGRIDDPTADED